MQLRRIFFYWQTAAALVLPAWLLIGWAIWSGGAAPLVALVIAVPLLAVAVLGVAGLTLARSSVRRARAVSWQDIAVLSVWHAALIGLGFFGPATAWFAVVAVLGALVAFWSATTQLIAETRRRMRTLFDDIQRAAAPEAVQRTPIDAGEYIVLDTGRAPSDGPERHAP